MLSFFPFRNMQQKNVSFLSVWNPITITLTGHGNTRIGTWHWKELDSTNLDQKLDLDRKLSFSFPCLLKADFHGRFWAPVPHSTKDVAFPTPLWSSQIEAIVCWCYNYFCRYQIKPWMFHTVLILLCKPIVPMCVEVKWPAEYIFSISNTSVFF